MTPVLLTTLLVLVAIGGLALVFGSQRRVAEAQDRVDALADQNQRLVRALGIAEQALRGVANDTRLDPGLALQVDAAAQDVRRAAEGAGRRLDP